jgi:steroid delta-isomerase-like uncharacterized protein
MTGDQIAAFIERHANGWNQRNPEALCHDHSEDGVIVSPMFARVQGRPQICRMYAALFETFPDWQIRFDIPIVDDRRLAISFSVTATHKGDLMGLAGTGRQCAFEGVSLFELGADALIRVERRVYDFTGLLTQLGVLRVRPAR